MCSQALDFRTRGEQADEGMAGGLVGFTIATCLEDAYRAKKPCFSLMRSGACYVCRNDLCASDAREQLIGTVASAITGALALASVASVAVLLLRRRRLTRGGFSPLPLGGKEVAAETEEAEEEHAQLVWSPPPPPPACCICARDLKAPSSPSCHPLCASCVERLVTACLEQGATRIACACAEGGSVVLDELPPDLRDFCLMAVAGEYVAGEHLEAFRFPSDRSLHEEVEA